MLLPISIISDANWAIYWVMVAESKLFSKCIPVIVSNSLKWNAEMHSLRMAIMQIDSTSLHPSSKPFNLLKTYFLPISYTACTSWLAYEHLVVKHHAMCYAHLFIDSHQLLTLPILGMFKTLSRSLGHVGLGSSLPASLYRSPPLLFECGGPSGDRNPKPEKISKARILSLRKVDKRNLVSD